MVAKVELIKQDDFYCVLTYLNSKKNPKLRTYFPYNNNNQKKQLEAARNFGKNIAKSHNTTLEENLNQNA